MGTPVLKEYIGKPPKFSAIQITSENIRDIAAWMGADSFTVSESIVGGAQFVKFGAIPQDRKNNQNLGIYENPNTHHKIGTEGQIGDWIVQIDGERWGDFEVRDRRYVIIEKEKFDEFLKEKVDSTAAPYDR